MSHRVKLAITSRTAIRDMWPMLNVGSIRSDADCGWFEVVTTEGTYQVIVQDAKATRTDPEG